VFAASVWIAFDSFDSALRITAATMQATCWSGEAATVRSGARHVLPSRILTSAISAANQILGARRGAIRGRHWAAQSDVRRRSVQQAGASGDGERRPATVGLRLTSEGSLVRTQLRPPGQRVFAIPGPFGGEPKSSAGSYGGRFGQAPRAWRRCHLLRGRQEPVHRCGLGGLRPRREAAAPEGLCTPTWSCC
jgi:hypothetical protein